MNAEYRNSIIKYLPDEPAHSCGYCHSKYTSFSDWVWAQTLTVDDYQELLDRGWRRCGRNCYKPVMSTTCCPMYTIKCAAKDFKVSKSQKKILKRFNNFIVHGVVNKNIKQSLLNKTEVVHSLDAPTIPDTNQIPILNSTLKKNLNDLEMGDAAVVSEPPPKNLKPSETPDKCNMETLISKTDGERKAKKSHQLKAKYLRIERKKQKLRNMGLSEKEIEKKMLEKKKQCTTKTLEDYLNESQVENPAHKLEIKLVSSVSEFAKDDTFEVFKRYQIHVHNDPPEKLSHHRYHRFLVDSPLEIRLILVKSPEFENTFKECASLFAKYQKIVHKESDVECEESVFEYFLVDSPLESRLCYGSYHQQYWLDGKLIAVGVIDILPKCLSSVYFLYDPDYMWLSLGTYGALREVEFVRKLASQYPDLKYYYMGYYINSCVKMRYKAAFKPSYLLCPEAYTWHPIQLCLPKLDKSKYSRLNEDLSVVDINSTVQLANVTVLYNNYVMSFTRYCKRKNCDAKEIKEVEKYASLVGRICAKRLLLHRV